MGLWSTIKGWLNIGGVGIKLEKFDGTLKVSDPAVSGVVRLTTKSPKEVLGVEVKLIEVHSYKKDDQSKQDVLVLGSLRFPTNESGLGYPLELKPGEDREQPFRFQVALPERMRHKGGMLGTVGKVGAFLSSDKLEYFLVAEASVKGAAFNTSHKLPVKISE